jgi:hypothetical protein
LNTIAALSTPSERIRRLARGLLSNAQEPRLLALSALRCGLFDLPVDGRDERLEAHSADDLLESRVVSVC